MYKRTRGFHPPALPLVGVVVRPAALRRFNLAGVGSAASVPAAAGLGCWCCLSGYVLPPGDRVGSDKGALCLLSPRDIRQRAIVGGVLEVLTLRKVSGGVCEITIGLRGCQTSGARNRAGPSLLLAAGELKAGLSARPVAASGRGRFRSR